MKVNLVVLLIKVVIPLSFLALDSSIGSLDSRELSILKTTLESLANRCKQTENFTQINANHTKSGDNYTEISVDIKDHKNCCSVKLFDISVKRVDFCDREDNEDLIFVYPEVMDFANETDINQKCMKLTVKSFCESVSNQTIENIFKETIKRSINSCNNSDIGEEFVTKNVVLIAKRRPEISGSSQSIIMRSFETEKLQLKCKFRAFPRPEIRWIRDDWLISEMKNSSEELESNVFSIKSQFDKTCTTVTILELPIRSAQMSANYSCVALNIVGKSSKTFLIDENTLKLLREEMKINGFNITGFVIGMIPPIFISFYIILKLGYRSRYAQESPDENGGNEELSFVGH